MSRRGDGQDDESPLSRWSRRKAEARKSAAEPVAEQPHPEELEASAAPLDEPSEAPETEEETLERLGLPDPDGMQPGDDFKPFMKAEVPEALRLRALRRLWRSDPALAVLDGLNDYDLDYTDAAMVKEGPLKTAYQIGRGFLTDADRAENEARRVEQEGAATHGAVRLGSEPGAIADAEATPAPDSDADAAEAPDGTTSEKPDSDQAEQPQADGDSPRPAGAATDAHMAPQHSRRPARMRFRVAGEEAASPENSHHKD